MPLPNLLIAGVPKAGTSTVHNYLAKHPDVFMAPVKEPHFFTRRANGWPQWGVKTTAEYEALFDGGEEHTLVGEGSTWYAYSRAAAELIHEQLPDVKIVIMLRNPADRAYSNWTFNVSHGWEPIDDFERALDAEEERREQDAPWHFYYFHAGLYHRQIQNYFDLFGRDRVGVFLLEDLKRDREGTLSDICTFLGIDPTPEAATASAHNKTFVFRNRTLRRVLQSNGPLKRLLRGLMPTSLWMPVRRFLVRMNRRKPDALSPESRLKLLETYRSDVEQLQSLLGRDLLGVWYPAESNRADAVGTHGGAVNAE